MLFTVAPNKLNYMLISTPCLLDLCQTWLLFLSLLFMHRNNSLSITVLWTPKQVQISYVTFNNRSSPPTQRKLPVSEILFVQGVWHRPAKQIHSNSCTVAVLPPSHKWRYFSSPILEQEGSSIILGARGAHSGPPMRVSVLRARFPAIAFPQTVKALPSSYPRAHVQRWQVALFVQPHTLGPILGLWWVVPPLYVRSGDTQGDWWTEKLKVQIYVKSLKEQIFALTACKTRGSWNKRKKGYLQS